MATVTIELRNVLKIKEFELFDFDYPIVDKLWKETLERDIIDYFYFNEIGQETIDRWKQRFMIKMRLIMPRYNELFKTMLYDVDPLINQLVEETYNEHANTKISSNSTSTGQDNNKTTGSVYPQHASVINDIPSNTQESTGSNSGSLVGSGSNEGQRDYNKVIKGYTGNVSDLILGYRSTIISINELIIKELKPLFIMVY